MKEVKLIISISEELHMKLKMKAVREKSSIKRIVTKEIERLVK